MSVFVVVWHMGGGGQSLIFFQNNYMEHIFSVSDFLNFHVLLLAVPTFIFISTFLYAAKGHSTTALNKRLKRLLVLLTVWPITFIVYKSIYNGVFYLQPNSIGSFVVTMVRAGNTIYYFFVCLIICLFVAHFILKLNNQLQASAFVLSVLVLTSLPALTKLTGFYPLSAYWSPFNFIPLSVAAVLFARNMNYVYSKQNILLPASLVVCVLFAVFEWRYSVGHIFFAGQGYAIPAYTRTSLLFSVIAISIVALNPNIKSNGIIKYMAKYSLALYCLHPFLITPIKQLAALFIQNHRVLTYTSILLVIASSYTIAMLYRRYYLNEGIVS